MLAGVRGKPSSRPTGGESCNGSRSSNESSKSGPAPGNPAKSRKQSEIQQVSIVGYTNAGKSTLLNALTDAGALVEDRLFATLDSTVRRLELPDRRIALLADTVGFVRRLPHHLVEAFQSTLAEVAEADLLLHVVDGTDQDPAGQLAAVREVLMRNRGRLDP